MSEPKAEPHPFEKLKEAMKTVLTVSKPEILKREADYKKQRKAKLETGS